MNIVNSSSITPIIETIVNQLLPNSSKSTVSEKCKIVMFLNRIHAYVTTVERKSII